MLVVRKKVNFNTDLNNKLYKDIHYIYYIKNVDSDSLIQVSKDVLINKLIIHCNSLKNDSINFID